jgi:hypothetical protein
MLPTCSTFATGLSPSALALTGIQISVAHLSRQFYVR